MPAFNKLLSCSVQLVPVAALIGCGFVSALPMPSAQQKAGSQEASEGRVAPGRDRCSVLCDKAGYVFVINAFMRDA